MKSAILYTCIDEILNLLHTSDDDSQSVCRAYFIDRQRHSDYFRSTVYTVQQANYHRILKPYAHKHIHLLLSKPFDYTNNFKIYFQSSIFHSRSNLNLTHRKCERHIQPLNKFIETTPSFHEKAIMYSQIPKIKICTRNNQEAFPRILTQTSSSVLPMV